MGPLIMDSYRPRPSWAGVGWRQWPGRDLTTHRSPVMGHKKKVHNLPPLGAAKAKGSKRGIKKVNIVIAQTVTLKSTVVAKLTQSRKFPSESDSNNVAGGEPANVWFQPCF